MLYRVYYSQENEDSLENSFAGFLSYLKRRSQVPEAHRDSGIHFIQMVSKMYKLYKLMKLDKLNPDRVKKLEQAIIKQPRLTMKPWLLKEVRKLYPPNDDNRFAES